LIIPNRDNAYLFGISRDEDKVSLLAWRAGVDWDWAGGFQSPDRITDLRVPVALTYTDDRGTNVHAFAVGKRDDGNYRLFQTHQVVGNDWSAWEDHGMPPDEPALPCEVPPSGMGGTQFVAGGPFTMTSACVWQDDQGLRINLFGHSDIVPNSHYPAVGSGSLVHFSWKGGDWRHGHWGWENTIRPDECRDVDSGARIATPFQTTSSAVYQGQTADGQARRGRVSVVGFTSPGRRGYVWEYALDAAVDQEFHWMKFG
jgi:hypothetical protein